MSKHHEEYDYMYSQEREKYFCLERTKFGAVLHCQSMFALQQNLLCVLQKEIDMLLRRLEWKEEGMFVDELCRTGIAGELWTVQFCADSLVLAGYQWIGVPTIVTLRGNTADLAFIQERFHHLFAKEELPFRQS